MADRIARRTVLETPAMCCAFGYYNMGRDETLGLMETGVYAHADEWRPRSISISRGAPAFVHKP